MNLAKQFIEDVISNLYIVDDNDKIEKGMWKIANIDNFEYYFINEDTVHVCSNMFKTFFAKSNNGQWYTSEIYLSTNQGYEFIFDKNTGLIISKDKPEDLSQNVFDWSEEDFFYFKLKYGL